MRVLVVGAGIVGLAIGREAALAGHEVIVVEAEAGIGSGTSSRNSEVIHAGLYYPTGSLRERHCARSRRMLYAYCASHGVPHAKLGKLVVACRDADLGALEKLLAQARRNGVEGLRMLSGAEATAMEPALSCLAALHSPETGIIDSHRYMLALLGDIQDAGGVLALRTPVERFARSRAGWEVHFGGSEPGLVAVDAVVNAAGHGAQKLARASEGYPPQRVPRLVLVKGNYFSYAGRPAFSRLIYPVAPMPGGLGIHVTLDLAGRMRFGPDAQWIDDYDFNVDPSRAAAFYVAVRTFWPDLPDGTLAPDYAGIRPKLTGPGEPPADFVIDAPPDHGVARLVHLFGIESPGLTAALSLAEEVVAKLGE